MGFYEERVLPRLIDVALGRPMEEIRSRVAAGLAGTVLEVGFGSGRNVPHYPAAVTSVLAVDPSLGARRLAAGRVAARGVRVDYAGLDGQQLLLDKASADHALLTWTLCTIPDPGRALAELRRVLKPGGTLHFVEHGRSPRQEVARWQDRLTPAWSKIAGGCHLNRPIDALLEGAGFRLERLERYVASHPAAFGYFYEGTAASD
ncbi:class I SAM-dependent methyltransferase [Acidiferrimicrobium sp. IK]|uniref:class I SAM-dependent methyltransferase n=1 Tax=Acidiferrimicrobium sp. IK TaxID=2871700 RepID=UPI0021CB5BD5|nr:class I SAM-dependent methyltransferase [Acidiferrimicrobium sp. IK]MCU4185520.1 class I SAM-dependent methyltransferase [Acidiferrimicrobium sp. IK]